MSKKNPNLIKVGDSVKIVTPNVFVRCGYPLTVSDMESEVEDYEEETMMKLLEASDYASMSFYQQRAYDKMKSGFMLYLLARRGFGGPERTIHVREDSSLQYMPATVTAIKRVVTGTYHHAGGYGEDYEPPYLTKTKHHRILELKTLRSSLVHWVPEVNVVKL